MVKRLDNENAISGDDAPPSLEECRQVIEALQQQLKERDDAYLLARADLENERRRSDRKIDEARKFGVGSLLEALLPVKDSLELALAAATQSSDVADLRQGVQLTLDELSALLADHGVETLDPLGEVFDPNVHEAVGVRKSATAPRDHVDEVYQKGYLLNGRLVRPARVIVSQGSGG